MSTYIIHHSITLRPTCTVILEWATLIHSWQDFWHRIWVYVVESVLRLRKIVTCILHKNEQSEHLCIEVPWGVRHWDQCGRSKYDDQRLSGVIPSSGSRVIHIWKLSPVFFWSTQFSQQEKIKFHQAPIIEARPWRLSSVREEHQRVVDGMGWIWWPLKSVCFWHRQFQHTLDL